MYRKMYRKIWMLAAAICVACGSGVTARAQGAASVTVIDGDSLALGGVEVRLWGIDVDEEWSATGDAATAYLAKLVEGQSVTCTQVGDGPPNMGRSDQTSHGRPVVRCFIGDTDIATLLVGAGHARDWPRYSGGFYADTVMDAMLPAEMSLLVTTMTRENHDAAVTALRRMAIRLLTPITDVDTKTDLQDQFAGDLAALQVALVADVDRETIENLRNPPLATIGRMAAAVQRTRN